MKLIPITTWNKNVRRLDVGSRAFVRKPWAQGIVLLICVAIAMLLANLPATAEIYKSVLEADMNIDIIGKHLQISVPGGMTVESFINDVLMTVFFFTVGLEIRRETTRGELSSVKKAILPVIAAFGGVIMPALIYAVVNHGTPAASGWGIPTATDIAFAVCILTVLGDRVPLSLKVFLTALAIADDLVAILVVALFYGGAINFQLLSYALVIMIATHFINKVGEKKTHVYVFIALIVWGLFYYAGIHSTMSGVVMAFLIPNKPRYTKAYYYRKRREYDRRLEEYEGLIPGEPFPNALQRHCLRRIKVIARGTMGMTDYFEHRLAPWVNFCIMPLFAIANAGVEITDLSYFNVFHVSEALGGVGLGVFLGLVVGKSLGISLASFIAIKCKVAAMPEKASWPMFIAVACLGGIGFTMSIFVDSLAFQGQEALLGAGKIAVLMGSVAAGILGSLLINVVSKKETNIAA